MARKLWEVVDSEWQREAQEFIDFLDDLSFLGLVDLPEDLKEALANLADRAGSPE